MEPDSEHVDRVIESLGSRRGAYGLRREYGAIVHHITGSGPLRRLLHEREWCESVCDDPDNITEIAARIYERIMEAGPHYLAGPDGERIQVCREKYAAWHIGNADGEAALYRTTAWQRKADVGWHLDRWHLDSPLKLAQGRLWGEELSANNGSIGVEFVWPYDRERTPPTDAQWRAVVELCSDRAAARSIPLTVYHLIGHSDAHPLARSANGQPWDPPPDWFNPSEVARRYGIPLMSIGPEYSEQD